MYWTLKRGSRRQAPMWAYQVKFHSLLSIEAKQGYCLRKSLDFGKRHCLSRWAFFIRVVTWYFCTGRYDNLTQGYGKLIPCVHFQPYNAAGPSARSHRLLFALLACNWYSKTASCQTRSFLNPLLMFFRSMVCLSHEPYYFSTRWNTNGPNIPSFHCSIIPIVSEAN